MVSYKLICCSSGSAFPVVLISVCRELNLGAELARHWCSRERNELVFSQFSLLNSQTMQWDPGLKGGTAAHTWAWLGLWSSCPELAGAALNPQALATQQCRLGSHSSMLASAPSSVSQQGLAVEQLKLDCGNDSFKIALQVFLKIHLHFFFFSQFNSCIWFTRSHRYTDRFYTCMCLNTKCVTGARRSWKSCWNHGSLVYTDAFTNLKGAFVCVTSIICFWVLCCVAVGAFSPAHLRWIIAETLLLFPNALEAGSLNCCLVGHCFQTSKSLLWK